MRKDDTWETPTRLCEGAQELDAKEKSSGWGVPTKISLNVSQKSLNS